MSINNAKFRRPVTPGDQLIFELRMVTKKTRICQMAGRAFVDGVVVAEAEMMASIVERSNVTSGGDGARSNATPSSEPSLN